MRPFFDSKNDLVVLYCLLRLFTITLPKIAEAVIDTAEASENVSDLVVSELELFRSVDSSRN